MDRTRWFTDKISKILKDSGCKNFCIYEMRGLSQALIRKASLSQRVIIISDKADFLMYNNKLTNLKIACPSITLCIVDKNISDIQSEKHLSEKLGMELLTFKKPGRKALTKLKNNFASNSNPNHKKIKISYGEYIDCYISDLEKILSSVCINPTFWAEEIVLSDKRKLSEISSDINYDILSDRKIPRTLTLMYDEHKRLNINAKDIILEKRYNFIKK